MSKKQTAPVGDVDRMVLEVPVRKATHGYKSNHVEIQLNRNESERLADVFSGLQRDGATMRDGKLITSPNHVLVWFLENMQPVEG